MRILGFNNIVVTLAAISSVIALQEASAFAPRHGQYLQQTLRTGRLPMPTTKIDSSSTRQFMSDVPQDTEDSSKKTAEEWLTAFFKPPPKPEDQFVMTGDLLSLCVYGFTDHFFCQTVSRMMVAQTLSDPTHHLSHAAASTLEANGASTNIMLQTPVWLDMNSPYTNQVLESNLSRQLVTQYSPLLEPMGQATCLLVACWLLAGWVHGAFLSKNTLDCSTERALMVTAQTWMSTCLLCFGIVMSSQAICGCDHFYLVTRGDLDYILDSSTVLVMWRFLASYLLGTGKDQD